jgi:superfamily I DNA/RNA helicase
MKSKKEVLNEQQQEVVNFKDGNCVVISASGSGKTRVITERVKKLVSDGVPQNKILIITFTKDSANDLKKRLGTDYKNVDARTFHSFCLSWLNRYGYGKELFNLDWKVEKHFKDLYGKSFDLYNCLSWISYQKNYGYRSNSPKFAEKEATYDINLLKEIYKEYEKYLKRNNMRDFDDMLLDFLDAVKKNKDLREEVLYAYKYVMVDEHQDSNMVQEKILESITGNGNLLVVGDYRQCLVKGTKIITDKGEVNIEDIKSGDRVLSASGRGSTNYGVVEELIETQSNMIFTIKTKSGKVLEGTPEHVVFVKQKNIIDYDADYTLTMFGGENNTHSLESHLYEHRHDPIFYSESYDSLFFCANEIQRRIGGNIILDKALILDNTSSFDFIPIGRLHEGDILVSLNNGALEEDEIISIDYISNISFQTYDINVKEYRNYIANGVCVHNCLYSFRGSNSDIILNFDKKWKNSKVIMLPTNYRSTDDIIDLANNFIREVYGTHNLYVDSLNSNKGNGTIKINEGDACTKIKELVDSGVDPNDIVILYRSHYLSDRPEIDAILGYLTLALDNTNKLAYQKVYNVPNRFLSKDFLSRALSYNGNLLSYQGNTSFEKKNVYELGNVMRNIDMNNGSYDAVKSVINASNIKDYIKDKYQDFDDRIGALTVLLNLAKKYKSVGQFLMMIDILRKTPPKRDGVRMMTSHASKGLEFPYVFVVNVDSQVFPHIKSPLISEQNLLYVSITRPTHSLYLYGNSQFITQLNSYLISNNSKPTE